MLRQRRHGRRRLEPGADGKRVAGLARENGGAQVFEPAQAGPEPVQDEPLQSFVAGRSLFPERLQVLVGPDIAAGVDERPAEPVALLEERNAEAQLERPPGRDQPGEAAADDGDAHRGS